MIMVCAWLDKNLLASAHNAVTEGSIILAHTMMLYVELVNSACIASIVDIGSVVDFRFTSTTTSAI